MELRIRVLAGSPSSIEVEKGSANAVQFHGSDLFHCLDGLRRDLESDGLLLCCQGARPDVFPSGMDRQMGDAREAHVLRSPRGRFEERVDIFAPAPFEMVATLDRQREFVMKYHGFKDR